MLSERKEWRKGWAVQAVQLRARDAHGGSENPVNFKRAYVKLWRFTPEGWRVEDRALTVRRAKQIAREIIAAERNMALDNPDGV